MEIALLIAGCWLALTLLCLLVILTLGARGDRRRARWRGGRGSSRAAR
jgi:hypothetical protein